MTSANHPPQPPTKRQDAPQVAGDHHATPHATNSHDTTHDAGKTRDVTSDVTKIQPLQGSLYAVGASHVLRIANSEFGISINQFDNHRNRFFDVIDRVQWVETDGEIVQRLILDVRGVIVQIVAHEYSPRTVLVWIDGDLRMVKRAALIFIFLHLAKRSQA